VNQKADPMAAEELLKEIRRIVRDETPFADAVVDIDFEGPRVVLYCKSLDLLMENGDAIRELARKIRKRIILRPDPSILTEKEYAEQKIREMVPADAGITDIVFNEDVGEVVIEAEKPGVVIGKGGALLREINYNIKWTPRVIRSPPIRSDFIRKMRLSMLQNAAERRDLMRRIGRRIHREPKARGDWVRITAMGGAREVGRSCFLLQTPESRIMIDCGINVASEERAYPHLEIPEVRLSEIDAVVISHAHLDHSGFAPYLFKYGFDGPVYCTPPTRDLSVLLQLDYVDIAEREEKPLPYDKKDIMKFLSHCITLDYGDVTDIAPDVRITLHNAGHILGSSVVHFHIGEGLHNVVYTGDLKFDRSRLLAPAACMFPRVESLILESTYGGAEDIQPPREEAEKELLNVINETTRAGGKVMIPAFAVGRAQEVMVLLEDCRKSGLVEPVPVYLDGMIWEATAIHTAYPEYLSQDLRERIFKADENPFLSENFIKVSGPDERAKVIEGEPCVIISTAGMMAGGPILEYFKHLAPDPRNSLVFVGYQAEGSLGRRIQGGWREIPLRGEGGRVEEVKVNLQVRTIEGFSGHSDRAKLLNYIRRMSSKPQRIITVHGDEKKCIDLAGTLHRLYKIETRPFTNLETIRLR